MTKEPKSTGGCMHAFSLDKQNSKTFFQHTLDFSRLQTLLQFLDNKHCIFYAFDWIKVKGQVLLLDYFFLNKNVFVVYSLATDVK